MAITRWQPFSDLFNIYDRIGRFFEEEFLGEQKKPSLSLGAWKPLTDIFETKDNYTFKIELPGFNKEDLKIEFSDDTLLVKGERKNEEEIKNENAHRIERSYGTFQRSFLMPHNIDPSKITAELKDGILNLKIPKLEQAETKAIPIKVK